MYECKRERERDHKVIIMNFPQSYPIREWNGGNAVSRLQKTQASNGQRRPF